MRETIRKLLAAATALAFLAFLSGYRGLQLAALAPPAQANDLSRSFSADPGDGWMLFGGFLMLVALALASAGVMLWRQERKVSN